MNYDEIRRRNNSLDKYEPIKIKDPEVLFHFDVADNKGCFTYHEGAWLMHSQPEGCPPISKPITAAQAGAILGLMAGLGELTEAETEQLPVHTTLHGAVDTLYLIAEPVFDDLPVEYRLIP